MSLGAGNDHNSAGPEPKKPRLEKETVDVSASDICQQLLVLAGQNKLPSSLLEGGNARNSIPKLSKLFKQHGLRTSAIQSPREGVSIYKDSCVLNNNSNVEIGKLFVIAMFGLHPQQVDMERHYKSRLKNLYCLLLFCRRLRQVIPKDTFEGDQSLRTLVMDNEQLFNRFSEENSDDILLSIHGRVRSLIMATNQATSSFRVEQLEHEYQRIRLWNSTLSNALVTLFQKLHQTQIKDICFKSSHQSKFERITVYLYDSNVDHMKPPHFLFLPCLKLAMDEGPEAVVNHMTDSFWGHLLRHGYFATPTLKDLLQKDLGRFFLSGISHNTNVPLQLNAHFNPSSALALYLYGKAGSGKSSLVLNFQPALEATIEEYMDPEVLVRHVKQNLNKPFETLALELELRPNNNDLSVMSIIQGRRMTMGQTKPGLVVVALEEMPSNVDGADPNQLFVSQLISQRFAGRNGAFSSSAKQTPRNSDKRGIQKDSSLITLVTSNYILEQPCQEALRLLPIFQHLSVHEITAVSGEDRVHFAYSYLRQCLRDRLFCLCVPNLELDIPYGDGDTRPLVRHLRMIAFYICQLVLQCNSNCQDTIIQEEIVVLQKGDHCKVSVGPVACLELKLGSLGNLFPIKTSKASFHPRLEQTIASLKKKDLGLNLSELSIILDFYLAKTLAPAVVVSRDAVKIQQLMETVALLENIHSLPTVNAGEYKMMKSLYDPTNTPNLRDDILKFGRGAFVAVYLQCPSTDAQLCIRELVEDSPSMTAFSTSKSALYKAGLLFGVHVNDEITPELASRASIII